jgi:hypothetical protein
MNDSNASMSGDTVRVLLQSLPRSLAVAGGEEGARHSLSLILGSLSLLPLLPARRGICSPTAAVRPSLPTLAPHQSMLTLAHLPQTLTTKAPPPNRPTTPKALRPTSLMPRELRLLLLLANPVRELLGRAESTRARRALVRLERFGRGWGKASGR